MYFTVGFICGRTFWFPHPHSWSHARCQSLALSNSIFFSAIIPDADQRQFVLILIAFLISISKSCCKATVSTLVDFSPIPLLVIFLSTINETIGKLSLAMKVYVYCCTDYPGLLHPLFCLNCFLSVQQPDR